MSAYVILVTEVTDEERHAEFRSRQPSLIEAKGGKVVMRGPVAEATDGETAGGRRIAVMEFPTVEQARAWVGQQSEPDYVALRELRDSAGNVVSYIVEGD